ncbi:MAG: UUP1 family membrane protein, partial [Bdellovibrionales bacterium]|nr:UUP1 family membrane protein [Bdellovibrionales bacterium]
MCILLGLLLAFSRHALHDIPFAAHSQAFRWEVELIVKAQAKGKPATLSVYNPSVRNAFQILDRSFSSKGFAISSARIDNRSTIDFYRKDPINGEQLFSIRYQMVRDLQKSVHPIASTSSHAFSRLEREKLE